MGLFASAFWGKCAVAQITPDTTLGAESSRVTPDAEVKGKPADLIEGGAARGANLFHSFTDFNVEELQRVYFANPAGIETILSRVTGANPSHILGTLGVDGAANLFLLNPHGILFGSNAQLDVEGSFVATTANSIGFEDGSLFSAANPEDSSLLTVSVPLGLQYGTNQSGEIANAGNLAVGQDLTLSAGNLDLQGQLYAGGDLTLEAQDTVRIRDSVDAPFLAAARGQLWVQGNQGVDIFALNHPDSGLFSGGDMVLRSAAQVGGDAHYWSGGSFRIERLDGSLGDLSSPNDPVIRTMGDVLIGAYQGSSLHIVAGGKVEIPGFVIITGADPTNGLQETVTLSDGTTVNIDGISEPTLDIRAGVDPSAIGVPSFSGTGNDLFLNPLDFPNTPTRADITIGDIFVFDLTDGGKVLLTNQYQPNLLLDTPNGITVGSIDVRDDFGGGSVFIDSRSSITLNGTVDASAFGISDTYFGDGGDVRLKAEGDINLNRGANIVSSGLLGGNITFNSEGDISIAEGLIGSTSFTNVVGVTGGEIQVTAKSLFLTEGATLATLTFGAGNAGVVKITATDLVRLDGESISVVPSSIVSLVLPGAEGNSGGIELTTASLELANGAQVNASTSGIGDAGAVKITATDSVRLDGEPSDGFIGGVFSAVQPGAEGNSGGIELTTVSLELTNGAQVDASTSGIGDAGAVKITATDSMRLDGEQSNGSIGGVFSAVLPGAEGSSGGIELTTASLEITNGAQVNASTGGIGDAGAVKITATDSMRLDGEPSDGNSSGVASQVLPGAEGNSGGIELTTASLELTNGAVVNSSTLGIGDAGAVKITATNSVRLKGESSDGFSSSIFSQVLFGAEGNSGGIELTTASLELTNGAQVSASSAGIGDAGAVKITATDSMRLDGESSDGISSSVASQVFPGAEGNSGEIELTTASLELTNGAQVNASSAGIGDAGAVKITATDSMRLDGESSDGSFSAVGSQVVPGAEGNSGGIELTTASLELTNGAQVNASTFGLGNAGAVKITATDSVRLDGEESNGFIGGVFSGVQPGAEGNSGGIELTTASLELTNGAQVDASTFGVGDAGAVKITATDSVRLDGESSRGISSGVASQVGLGAEGNSEGIELTTASLELTNGAVVSASTFGVGDAGAVKITATDSVRLDGESSDGSPSSIFSQVLFGSQGNSGGIELTTASLELTNGAVVNASTRGIGDAGAVKITATDLVRLDGESSDGSPSGVASQVILGAEGNSGEIELTTASLELTNGAVVNTSTFGIGNAGAVKITATDSMRLDGESSDGSVGGVASQVGPGAEGNSEGIELKTASLELTNGAQVSASTFGVGDAGAVKITATDSVRLDGESNGVSSGVFTIVAPGAEGNSKGIELTTPSLELTNGAQVNANTFGGGNAGDISVRDAQSVFLDNNSSISTAVNPDAKGIGGDIEIQTHSLSLENNSQISAQSQGQSRAGNITLQVSDTLTATDSDIITATTQSAGGAIDITAQDIRLRGDSDITTSVFSGAENGGNITITTDSLIAFADSDILAFARDGRGGDITFKTPVFFGFAFRPAPKGTDPATLDNNNRVDINASGAVDGVITLPNLDFIQNSLTELPENLIDTDNLLANSCIVRTDEQEGTFIITGAGNLPTRPGDASALPYPTGEVRAVPSESTSRPWQKGDPIVEPTGVYQLPNGRLVMARECS
jgi:filamentous hemagglutinin family protein